MVSEANSPTLTQEDTIALSVGWAVLGLVALMYECGWESPQGALPYLHPEIGAGIGAAIVTDLTLLGQIGDSPEKRAASERLTAIAPEWSHILNERQTRGI